MSTTNNKKRNILIIIVLVVFALAYVLWYILNNSSKVSTDDAYVVGRQMNISSSLSGKIQEVFIHETQKAKKGDVLIQLNPNELLIQQLRAEASLKNIIRNTKAQYIKIEQLKDKLRAQEIKYNEVKEDLQRRVGGDKDGSVLAENVVHAKNSVLINKEEVDSIKKELQALQIQFPNEKLLENPNIQTAIANLKQVYLDEVNSKILAPSDGVIAKRSVEVGQKVMVGQPLMALVPLDSVWIEANFKESKLAHVKKGQSVKIVSDLYGEDVVYEGIVVGLNAGTGSAFSALPAQNATGNWIKIVQRVPVRIYIVGDTLKQYPLRIGMSMTVSIDTKTSNKLDFEKNKYKYQDSIQDLVQEKNNKAEQRIKEFLNKII